MYHRLDRANLSRSLRNYNEVRCLSCYIVIGRDRRDQTTVINATMALLVPTN